MNICAVVFRISGPSLFIWPLAGSPMKAVTKIIKIICSYLNWFSFNWLLQPGWNSSADLVGNKFMPIVL
jgi:hypothetical protein